MTETVAERSIQATVRSYRPADHRACRDLWAELVEYHRDLYEERGSGGSDPGAGFEEYLTQLDLTGVWVAETAADGVVGMVGLLLRGRAGEVEPVVVTQRRRGRGIGRALLEHVGREARKRGITSLTVNPKSRNEAAIQCLYKAGFDALASVTLTIDLSQRDHIWQDGIDLHGLRFHY